MQERTKTILNTSLFFLTAIAFGVLEGSGHIVWGPPNFGPFHLYWNLPMAVISLCVAGLSGYWYHLPAYYMLEDMVYWIASHFIWNGPELVKESWVSQGLGGFIIFNSYFPWMYVILLSLWGTLLFLRWSYRQVCLLHE